MWLSSRVVQDGSDGTSDGAAGIRHPLSLDGEEEAWRCRPLSQLWNRTQSHPRRSAHSQGRGQLAESSKLRRFVLPLTTCCRGIIS